MNNPVTWIELIQVAKPIAHTVGREIGRNRGFIKVLYILGIGYIVVNESDKKKMCKSINNANTEIKTLKRRMDLKVDKLKAEDFEITEEDH